MFFILKFKFATILLDIYRCYKVSSIIFENFRKNIEKIPLHYTNTTCTNGRLEIIIKRQIWWTFLVSISKVCIKRNRFISWKFCFLVACMLNNTWRYFSASWEDFLVWVVKKFCISKFKSAEYKIVVWNYINFLNSPKEYHFGGWEALWLGQQCASNIGIKKNSEVFVTWYKPVRNWENQDG